MKKLLFFMGTGLMILSSCSSDEIVNPVNTNAGESNVPMGFFVATPNMSRANTLQTEAFDFGVWAYKSTEADRSDIAEDGHLVMKDYLVGFDGGTFGYTPTMSQTKYYGSPWIYENYGYDASQSGFTFAGDPLIQNIANASTQQFQYLKYWDGTAGMHTYFYSVAPYNATAANDGAFDPSTETLTLGALEMALTSTDKEATTEEDIKALNDWSTAANFMYAFKDVKNADMYGPVKVYETVPLDFCRLGSKIRMAFYESIPGYHVEIIPYSTDYPYIYGVPSVDGTYAPGVYTYKYDDITLDFSSATSSSTVAVAYGTANTTGKSIISPLWLSINGVHQANNRMTESNAATSLLCTSWKNVVPAQTGAGATPNDGFTLNVSFRLIAEDTGEVIYVRGARVHVPADKCAWLPNHSYTYVFHITKLVPGQVADPGNPTPDPNSNYGLWPIVFDNVTVETLGIEESYEYDLN